MKPLQPSLIAALLLLLLWGCQPSEMPDEERKTLLLGHAGMGVSSAYPMNSLESLLCCLNSGMDGVEMDVQMTSDHVLVAYHPSDLSENTTLQGPVSQHTWAEIAEAIHLDLPHLPYRVIRVSDLFDALDTDDSHFFSFDCKFHGWTDYQPFAQALSQLIEQYHLQDRVSIESGNIEFLIKMEMLQSQALTFYYHPTSQTVETSLELAKRYGLDGISADNKHVTSEMVTKADGMGIRFMLWNLQSSSNRKKALEKHPFAIQVD